MAEGAWPRRVTTCRCARRPPRSPLVPPGRSQHPPHLARECGQGSDRLSSRAWIASTRSNRALANGNWRPRPGSDRRGCARRPARAPRPAGPGMAATTRRAASRKGRQVGRRVAQRRARRMPVRVAPGLHHLAPDHAFRAARSHSSGGVELALRLKDGTAAHQAMAIARLRGSRRPKIATLMAIRPTRPWEPRPCPSHVHQFPAFRTTTASSPATRTPAGLPVSIRPDADADPGRRSSGSGLGPGPDPQHPLASRPRRGQCRASRPPRAPISSARPK